ncbi:MAG: hypothetical protein ABJZ55_20465 [Fuerstiella sp.]
MTTLRINFDGDASALIAEHRKLAAELRRESGERRKADAEARQLSANERARLKLQITEGKNAKRVFVDVGRAAADAMKGAKDPSEEYTKALFKQQSALDAGAISLEQFKQRKFALLKTLRDAKAAQSGENDVLRQAGILVDKARSATEIYDGKAAALKTALDRGKISQQQYNDAVAEAQRELIETKDAQSGANQQLRLAASLVDKAKTAADRYDDKLRALNLALKRGKVSQDQHSRAVGQAKRELDQAGASNNKWTASLKSSLGTMVGVTSGAAAAGTAIAVIRAEYDHLLRRQDIALGRTTTLAQAQEQASGNLGNVPEMNLQELFGRVRSASQDLGVDEVGLTRAVSDALSARGNKSADDAVDSVIAAAKLRRFSLDELPQLSAASLDISKGTGMGLEESLGFLMEVGTQSRITNLKALSENVAPSLTSAKLYDVSPAFAGSTSAALSQSIVDPTGQTTRTATTKLFQQLSKFRPEDNIADTLAAIQSSADLQREFFAAKTEGGFAASFEAKALPSIQALLQQGTTESKQFADSLAKLSQTDGQARFDKQVADVDSLPAVQAAKVKQIADNLGDQLTFADPSLAISAAVRDGLKTVRESLGDTEVGTKLTQIAEDFTAGGERGLPELVRKFELLQRGLLVDREVVRQGFIGLNQVKVVDREVTDLERSQAATIGKAVEQLRKLAELQEANAAKPGRAAAPVAEPANVPPPIAVAVPPVVAPVESRVDASVAAPAVDPSPVAESPLVLVTPPSPVIDRTSPNVTDVSQLEPITGPISVSSPAGSRVAELDPLPVSVAPSVSPRDDQLVPESSQAAFATVAVVEAVSQSGKTLVDELKGLRSDLAKQAVPQASTTDKPLAQAAAARTGSVGRYNRRKGTDG